MKNLALFIIGSLTLGCSNPAPTQTTNPKPEKETPVVAQLANPALAEVDQYMATKGEGIWWLRTRVSVESLDKKLTDPLRDNITTVFNHYGNLTPETGQVKKAYSDFNVGVAINTPQGPGVSIDTLSHPNGRVTVVFFPQEDVPYHPSALWYDKTNNTVFVAAVVWPETVFPAVLIHELYHALQAEQGAASASAPTDSPEYMAEEVAAHNLEAKVMDHATGGEYFKLMDGFLAERGISDWKEAYKALTKENLMKLDAVFKTSDAGINVLTALVAQHIYVAGMRSIEQSIIDKSERLAAMIEYYQHTRRIFGGG